MTTSLAGIYRYPVKSCRREEMQHAEVEPWGLAGGRRWMVVDAVVDAAGSCVTAREHARLVPVSAQIDAGGRRAGRPAPLITPVPGKEAPCASS